MFSRLSSLFSFPKLSRTGQNKLVLVSVLTRGDLERRGMAFYAASMVSVHGVYRASNFLRLVVSFCDEAGYERMILFG